MLASQEAREFEAEGQHFSLLVWSELSPFASFAKRDERRGSGSDRVRGFGDSWIPRARAENGGCPAWLSPAGQ